MNHNRFIRFNNSSDRHLEEKAFDAVIGRILNYNASEPKPLYDEGLRRVLNNQNERNEIRGLVYAFQKHEASEAGYSLQLVASRTLLDFLISRQQYPSIYTTLIVVLSTEYGFIDVIAQNSYALVGSWQVIQWSEQDPEWAGMAK